MIEEHVLERCVLSDEWTERRIGTAIRFAVCVCVWERLSSAVLCGAVPHLVLDSCVIQVHLQWLEIVRREPCSDRVGFE